MCLLRLLALSRLALLSMLMLPASYTVAQSESAQAQQADKPVDLRIVLDISAPMQSRYPRGEHLDAIRLLLSRLPAGSKAGVWTYGRYVNHYIQHAELSPLWLEQALRRLPQIKSVASEAGLDNALAEAAYDIALEQSAYRRVLMVLSAKGGVGQSDKPAAGPAKDIYSRVRGLRQAGFQVHTLGPAAKDNELPLTLLAQETGGYAFETNNAAQTYSAVLQLAEWVGKQNYIPLDNGRFAVDAYASELEILLLNQGKAGELRILTPSGAVLAQGQDDEGVDWSNGDGYDLVRLKKPELGAWHIEGKVHAASRVYVTSQTRLVLEGVAAHYFGGEDVSFGVKALARSSVYGASTSIRLQRSLPTAGQDQNEPGLPKVEQVLNEVLSGGVEAESIRESVLESVTESLTESVQESVQESSWETNLRNLEPGIYRLTLLHERPDFSRALDYRIEVDPLLTINVAANPGERDRQAPGRGYLIKAQPDSAQLNLGASSLIVTITDAAQEWVVRTVPYKQDEGYWLLDLSSEKGGEYVVNFDFQSQTLSGREISYQPPPLRLHLPGLGPQESAAVQDGALDPVPDALESGLMSAQDNDKDQDQGRNNLSSQGRSPFGHLKRMLVAGIIGLVLFGLVLWGYLAYRAHALEAYHSILDEAQAQTHQAQEQNYRAIKPVKESPPGGVTALAPLRIEQRAESQDGFPTLEEELSAAFERSPQDEPLNDLDEETKLAAEWQELEAQTKPKE